MVRQSHVKIVNCETVIEPIWLTGSDPVIVYRFAW